MPRFVSATINFQASALVFSVVGTRLTGITFDNVTQTLWISDSNNVYNYTTAGVLISQFAHVSGDNSLAYERSTDTLWLVTNGSDTITQYSKAGAVLQTLVVAGLASNNWGAEFGPPAAAIITPSLAIPTLSEWTMVGLAGMLALFGMMGARRVRRLRG